MYTSFFGDYNSVFLIQLSLYSPVISPILNTVLFYALIFHMPLKISIIGVGLIGPRHAQAVLSNPSTELVALVDPAPSGPATAAQLQTRYFPSVSSMLTSIDVDNKPDAAIVCTPNDTHVPVSKELLSAGLHVLVEKPLSTSIDTGLSLLRHAARPEHAHLRLLVGHHRRFNPYVVKTKELIESNSLGRIIAVNGLWTLYKPPEYFSGPTSWRRSRETGGGVVLINLVHDIDILQHLFGPIVRVHAERTAPSRPNPPHDAEDGAAITFRFASGVVGTFLVCDATPSPHNFEAGTGENPTIPRTGEDFYRIFGSEACLSVPDMTRWNYDGQPVKSWTQELTVERVEVSTDVVPLEAQLAHFVDVIQGQAEPSCTGEAGLRALVVCDAVRRAMESGMPVDVVDVGEMIHRKDSVGL